jgi:hypothetical protein
VSARHAVAAFFRREALGRVDDLAAHDATLATNAVRRPWGRRSQPSTLQSLTSPMRLRGARPIPDLNAPFSGQGNCYS